MKDRITVEKIGSEEDLAIAHDIRQAVFVMEQHCPPELEWEHEEESVHFLAKWNEEPCGTARWRQTANGYKLERFAVLKPFRGKGVAHALVQFVLADLPPGAKPVYLNAQVTAVPVYSKSGFQPVGDLFEEAGITHRKMVLDR